MPLPSFEFDSASWTASLLAVALFVLVVHLVPYVVDARGIRTIPGPWLAKYTDAWLGRVAAKGHRSEVVHEMHKKYGEYPIKAYYLRLVRTTGLTAFSPSLSRNLCPTRSKPCFNL